MYVTGIVCRWIKNVLGRWGVYSTGYVSNDWGRYVEHEICVTVMAVPK